MRRVRDGIILIVVCIFGAQILLSAMAPYMGIVGIVLAGALIGLVLGGLAFIGYRAFQNVGSRDDQGM